MSNDPIAKVAKEITDAAKPVEIPGPIAAQRLIAAVGVQHKLNLNDFLSGLVAVTAGIIANVEEERHQMVLMREVTSTLRELVTRSTRARKAEAAAAAQVQS